MADAWIIDAVRTPRAKGRPDGALHAAHPQELLAQCQALAGRVGFNPAEVDDVIAGNGILTGDHEAVGRFATLLAGWPETVPGMTLNRFCGSAQQAITIAAMGVRSGEQDLVVADGVESMSRWNRAAGSATIDGFTRSDVDAFAVESQRTAAVAMNERRFDRGLVPVTDLTMCTGAGMGTATILDRL